MVELNLLIQIENNSYIILKKFRGIDEVSNLRVGITDILYIIIAVSSILISSLNVSALMPYRNHVIFNEALKNGIQKL